MPISRRTLVAAFVIAGPFALSGAQAQSKISAPSFCKAHPNLCQPTLGKRHVDLRPAPPTKADLTTNPGKPTPPPRS